MLHWDCLHAARGVAAAAVAARVKPSRVTGATAASASKLALRCTQSDWAALAALALF
jgi:hypothetical protein